MTMNYYAVRANNPCPSHPLDKFCTICAGRGWTKAKKWDVVMLIQDQSKRYDGLYSFPGGDRLWLSQITWEEFDMLQAFGVETIRGFDHDIQTMRGHPERTGPSQGILVIP